MEKHLLHGNYYRDEMQVFVTLIMAVINNMLNGMQLLGFTADSISIGCKQLALWHLCCIVVDNTSMGCRILLTLDVS